MSGGGGSQSSVYQQLVGIRADNPNPGMHGHLWIMQYLALKDAVNGPKE